VPPTLAPDIHVKVILSDGKVLSIDELHALAPTRPERGEPTLSLKSATR
jgi:hypothetical protein